ncbi:GerAB/ArcD/ProY family transporter [Sporosarcina highlanderae]|uniref:GerAB/ArcD/ProY family transporter n=1 Tax=Sporosarcina highlanderae TaxID=3035916 RepID=A0ABT8JTD3_9BACL|nr:GerAB/ArcD/ProY family transporter [Sporosarcina highlanderae]MDN4607637.1 GerAB/ArcD/ProY family transporter [Sporosarcina highlanderae]
MMFTLSRIQFFLLLFVFQTGTVFLSFQSRLIDVSGTNSWVLFILAGLLHYLQLFLFEKFHKRFNPGPFVSHLYIVYWFFIIVSFLAYINYTIAIWLFPNTPQIVTMAFMVGVSLYANTRKPETLINLPVIILPMIPFFVLFLFMALPELVWTYLFPIDVTDYKSMLKGLFFVQATFIGVEMFLFLRKYVKADEKVNGKPLFIYQSIWFLFFFTGLIFVLLFFPLNGFKFVTEPLLYLLKFQKVTFVERLDLFFLFIWISWSIITISIYIFMCIHVRKTHYKSPSNRFIILFHVLIVITSTFLATKDRIEIIRQVSIYAHIVFSVFFPAVVILMNRRGKQ